MKRFQFPLERVRRWRAEQAAMEELKLEQLAAQLTAIREERRNIENQRVRTERELLGQPSIQATELQSLDAYRLYTRNKIRETETRECQAAASVEQQRQKVIEARRQAELLERLKRKALDEWQTASDQEQETLAAELHLAKRARAR